MCVGAYKVFAGKALRFPFMDVDCAQISGFADYQSLKSAEIESFPVLCRCKLTLYFISDTVLADAVILLYLYNFQQSEFCDFVEKFFAHVGLCDVCFTALTKSTEDML